MLLISREVYGLMIRSGLEGFDSQHLTIFAVEMPEKVSGVITTGKLTGSLLKSEV